MEEIKTCIDCGESAIAAIWLKIAYYKTGTGPHCGCKPVYVGVDLAIGKDYTKERVVIG